MVRWNTAVQTVYGGSGPQLVMLDLDGTLIDTAPDFVVVLIIEKICFGAEVAFATRIIEHAAIVNLGFSLSHNRGGPLAQPKG